jgi:hypothetical protein
VAATTSSRAVIPSFSVATSSTHPINTGTTSPESGLSRGARGGIAAAAAVGALIVFFLVIWLIISKRRKARRDGKLKVQAKGVKRTEIAETSFGYHYGKAELRATPNQVSELNDNCAYPAPPTVEAYHVNSLPIHTVLSAPGQSRMAISHGPAELVTPHSHHLTEVLVHCNPAELNTHRPPAELGDGKIVNELNDLI